MSADPRIEATREFICDLAGAFVDGGAAKVHPFIEGLATDLDQLWTVPINRQEQFLTRMQLHARALPELGRLHMANSAQDAFLRSIVAAIRFAMKVAL